MRNSPPIKALCKVFIFLLLPLLIFRSNSDAIEFGHHSTNDLLNDEISTNEGDDREKHIFPMFLHDGFNAEGDAILVNDVPASSVSDGNNDDNKKDLEGAEATGEIPDVPTPPQQASAMEPELDLLDLGSYCFGAGDFVQLGPCSSTRLRCGNITADLVAEASPDEHGEVIDPGDPMDSRPFLLEECPLGSVFHKGECKPAHRVKDCFNTEVNLLNDATEKLAKAVDYCASHPFGITLHFSSDANGREHVCSRQALLCRGLAAPISISCPSEKVLDLKTISCIDPPPGINNCAFVSQVATTPIREHLLSLFCHQQQPLSPGGDRVSALARLEHFASIKPPQIRNSLTFASRCHNWYAVCRADQMEFVFCSHGKIFDAERMACRRVLPTDHCPLAGACSGWEWRMSPVGTCQQDFIFCNGLRPQLFQCTGDDEVFIDGECQKAAHCNTCVAGDARKTTNADCKEFEYCEGEENGSRHWKEYVCDEGRVFDPTKKICVYETEYQCPEGSEKCKEADSYTVECGDFFFCLGGRYLPGRCPHMTRWDDAKKRCIFDAKCQRFEENLLCKNGQTKPSVDCENFQECVNGRFVRRLCRDYTDGSNRVKGPCQFCRPHHSLISLSPNAEAEKSLQRQDYPLDTLLPEGFNPFAGQGVRPKICVDGERIVNRFNCERFMECQHGDWFSLACPSGYFFSVVEQTCVASGSTKSTNASCASTSATGQSTTTLAGSNTEYSARFSDYLLPPLYSPKVNGEQTAPVAFSVPGAGPLPVLSKADRRNYIDFIDFCDGVKSPTRVPDLYDCAKYRECARDNGGFYVEKQCAPGRLFDPNLLQCTENYVCSTSECVEAIREPRDQCGTARRCLNGRWQNVHCGNGKAFVNGRCSQIDCPKNDSIDGSTNNNFGFANYLDGRLVASKQQQQQQCVNGHTMVHPLDCSAYLRCRYGQWTEERCHNGHQFNPKIGRCDPLYKCFWGTNEEKAKATHRPVCYEGEMRAIMPAYQIGSQIPTPSEKCSIVYELCLDARYERQTCPYGRHFDAVKRRCIDGDCSVQLPTSWVPSVAEKPSPSYYSQQQQQQYPSTANNEIGKNGAYAIAGGSSSLYAPAATANAGYYPANTNAANAGYYPPSTNAAAGNYKCKESPGTDGFRPDANDCAKFYQCANGKWVPKDCASGTVFNPILGVCDWPTNVAGC